jgi:TatD DNase family protein
MPSPQAESAPELIDTHAHLASSDMLPHAPAMIERANAAGVTRTVCVACTVAEWPAARRLAAEHSERIMPAFGIHPHDAASVRPEHLASLDALLALPETAAAGEMGLDYHYDFSPRDVQRDVFSRQLEMARRHRLPVVIHAREAHADVVRILLDEGFTGRPVVFHCFGGSPDEAAELRARGWWTSFTGVVTFHKSHETRQACRETPLDQLMFETDAPYLSPEPVRRTRPNEPALLVHTARFAAELRGEPFDVVARASTANALRFFRRLEDADAHGA